MKGKFAHKTKHHQRADNNHFHKHLLHIQRKKDNIYTLLKFV